ncbi:SRPBCC domain-containing protein [Asticcacaulis sp. 201]|uniref:SRPBCC domain-containing protein n=1 Tax=Asticcacaulis sp. 201 TaxID=3028787 RepID=UPI002916F5D7|nr:SRPBCC domain-containing protein [Asticcacaulis sp. 201]MDV6331579.1 SRPBCC domain-containing protein [Asticcacaulis sp. 201]
MTRSATPETFSVERIYDHPLSLVFWAFTNLEAKTVWYGGGAQGWDVTHHSLDFTVGGWERWRGRPNPEAPWMTNDALYLDILADERIIFSYHMTMDEALFTVSQQVLEFSAKGTGCHLKVVEQILFIDGVDHLEDRVAGTQGMLDTLAAYLSTLPESTK